MSSLLPMTTALPILRHRQVADGVGLVFLYQEPVRSSSGDRHIDRHLARSLSRQEVGAHDGPRIATAFRTVIFLGGDGPAPVAMPEGSRKRPRGAAVSYSVRENEASRIVETNLRFVALVRRKGRRTALPGRLSATDGHR